MTPQETFKKIKGSGNYPGAEEFNWLIERIELLERAVELLMPMTKPENLFDVQLIRNGLNK